MRVANATTIIFVLWLDAALYWNDHLCVCSLILHVFYNKSCIINIKINKSEQVNKPFTYTRYLKNVILDRKTLTKLRNKKQHIFFLATSPLQAPLIDK
jgi:hypothetical protein